MLHVNPERLAELADVEPTAQEAAHLAGCPSCARELDAYQSLLALAGAERLALAPPITDWKDLAAELREEGLIPDTTAPLAPRPAQVAEVTRGGSRWVRPWLQVAAAVVLAAAGVLGGRWSMQAGAKQGSEAIASRQHETAVGNFRQVADQHPDSVNLENAFVSMGDAQQVLRRAEQDYRLAVLYLAAHDTTHVSNADLYRARLAALDAMAGVAQKAVQEIPQDPVINQYYLSATAARQATLAQLGRATGEQFVAR